MTNELVVDANEPEEIDGLLRRLGTPFARRRIAPGDYVAGEVGVERKTVRDFWSSLLRKRLFEQLTRLRDAYPVPLLVLEGDVGEVSEYRQPSAWFGAFLAIELKERIPILNTADLEQTAQLLHVLQRRIEAEPTPYGLRHKPKMMSDAERQRFLVEGLPSVGDILARNLLERFGSVRGVFTADESDLRKVTKIGDAKAAEIVRLVTTRFRGDQTTLDGEGP